MVKLMAVVAVFTALHEEKEILAEMLGTSCSPQGRVWTRQVGSTNERLELIDHKGSFYMK